MTSDRLLLFLCSGTSKAAITKLSFRVATYLQDLGIAEIGSLAMLSEQHAAQVEKRRKMIFINDCNSSCVKLLTHRFDPSEYLYVDVTAHKGSPEFNIKEFVENEIVPKVSGFAPHLTFVATEGIIK